MKSILLMLFLSTTIACMAQDPQYVNDTIITSSGYKVYKGVVLKLGRGTMPNGAFKYIRNASSSSGINIGLSSTNQTYVYADANHSGRQAEVASTKKEGSKKTGYAYYAVLKMGEMIRYDCDVENALATGEVVLPNEFKKPNTAAHTQNPGMTNLAEELGKLKKMYTDSLITKDEYEAAKKKLLNN